MIIFGKEIDPLTFTIIVGIILGIAFFIYSILEKKKEVLGKKFFEQIVYSEFKEVLDFLGKKSKLFLYYNGIPIGKVNKTYYYQKRLVEIEKTEKEIEKEAKKILRQKYKEKLKGLEEQRKITKDEYELIEIEKQIEDLNLEYEQEKQELIEELKEKYKKETIKGFFLFEINKSLLKKEYLISEEEVVELIENSINIKFPIKIYKYGNVWVVGRREILKDIEIISWKYLNEELLGEIAKLPEKVSRINPRVSTESALLEKELEVEERRNKLKVGRYIWVDMKKWRNISINGEI